MPGNKKIVSKWYLAVILDTVGARTILGSVLQSLG